MYARETGHQTENLFYNLIRETNEMDTIKIKELSLTLSMISLLAAAAPSGAAVVR